MLLSQNNGQVENSQMDEGVLDRIRVMEAELDEVRTLYPIYIFKSTSVVTKIDSFKIWYLQIYVQIHNIFTVSYIQVSRKYKTSTSVLEEKQEELKVQKDEIKLLRMTVESYDSKVNEQTDLITKLEKELTNVKG